MWTLSVKHVFLLQAVVLALAEDKTMVNSKRGKEPPARQQEAAPTEPEMDGLGWCKEDQKAAEVCIACAQLPGVLAQPPDECCSDPDVLDLCKTCVNDPIGCLREDIDIFRENGVLPGESEEKTLPAFDKRFGMLFLGNRPNYANEYPNKRFGTLNLGNYRKRSEDGARDDGEDDDSKEKRWGSLGMSKRFGTLNLGSYFNKRYGMLGMGTPYLGYLGKGYGNMGKRFGTLNLGGGRYRFAKRFGTLNMDKKWGTLNMGQKRDLLADADLEKRYGTLNLGKRYGTLNLGKRYGSLNMGSTYGSSPSLGKRYGTLNMGSSYGYFPHKRDEYVPYNGNIGIDMRKRYGRLFMGRYGGKRLGLGNEIKISEIKK